MGRGSCRSAESQHFPVFGARPPLIPRDVNIPLHGSPEEAENVLATDAGTGGGMDRRRFVAAIGGTLAAPFARAQKKSGLPVLGVLTPHPPAPPEAPGSIALRARYKQLGWVDGETFHILRPNAEGREDRLPAIATELVRNRVNVIWALGPEAAIAAARATSMIPIVFWGVGLPVEQGLVDSIARPGRNVTGIAFFTGSELTLKVLELAKEALPHVKRVSVVRTPSANQTVKGEQLKPTVGNEQAMQRLGLDIQLNDVASVDDFDATFATILKARPHLLFVPGTTLTFRERRRFTEFALHNALPSAFNQREFVVAGGLLSYGIDSSGTILESFGYVDKILRGAKPADLPVELPSRYELVINRKTEKALGLTISQSVLLRADRVIE